jgi:hypothetical protein
VQGPCPPRFQRARPARCIHRGAVRGVGSLSVDDQYSRQEAG